MCKTGCKYKVLTNTYKQLYFHATHLGKCINLCDDLFGREKQHFAQSEIKPLGCRRWSNLLCRYIFGTNPWIHIYMEMYIRYEVFFYILYLIGANPSSSDRRLQLSKFPLPICNEYCTSILLKVGGFGRVRDHYCKPCSDPLDFCNSKEASPSTNHI